MHWENIKSMSLTQHLYLQQCKAFNPSDNIHPPLLALVNPKRIPPQTTNIFCFTLFAVQTIALIKLIGSDYMK